MRTKQIHVTVDLARVRAAAQEIRGRVNAGLIAVIKADAYGLGARRVADALDGLVDEYAYFSIDEARELGRPGVIIGPPEAEPAAYRELGVRPALGTLAAIERFRDTPFILSVDSGMQRFGCSAAELEEILSRFRIEEAYTHAVEPEAVERFKSMCAGRIPRLHAAASALLHEPKAWLSAVRPGYALYRGSVRVSTRIHTIRRTSGPVGYSGFESPLVGIILAGYSNGLEPAPVRVNGRPQRVLECGMNTSFVSLDPQDRVGDEVLLCGDELDEAQIGAALHRRPHEVLCRYCALGVREYRGGEAPSSTRVSFRQTAQVPTT